MGKMRVHIRSRVLQFANPEQFRRSSRHIPSTPPNIFKSPPCSWPASAPFTNNPALLRSPYRVKSPVTAAAIREFVSALEGGSIEITAANLRALSQLSDEFGFAALSAQLWAFRTQANSVRAQNAVSQLRAAFSGDDRRSNARQTNR
jgi:hypothetical protein